MAAVLEHWREAATLIIAARFKPKAPKKLTGVSKQSDKTDCSQTSYDYHNHYDYKVLMLKRSTKSKFMPNLYVFPGGTAEDVDFSADWLEVFNHLEDITLSKWTEFVKRGGEGPFMFSRKRSSEFERIPSEVAFRICAIRETFEESGVLLVRNAAQMYDVGRDFSDHKRILGTYANFDDSIIDSWRKRVLKDPKEFINMCKELKVIPDIWSLAEWSNWLTPASTTGGTRRSRRYDTAFFLCVLDDIPPASHDDQEMVHSLWCPPDELIRSHVQHKGTLAPPQILELSRMLNFQDAGDLHNFAWQRTKQRVSRCFPVPLLCDEGVIILYPGDELYPENPDFEGITENSVKQVSGTFKEVEQKHPRTNRVEGKIPPIPGKLDVINCQIKPIDGQVRPLQYQEDLHVHSSSPKL